MFREKLVEDITIAHITSPNLSTQTFASHALSGVCGGDSGHHASEGVTGSAPGVAKKLQEESWEAAAVVSWADPLQEHCLAIRPTSQEVLSAPCPHSA